MLLNLKRLVTTYPHRPWRMPRRLLLLALVLFGFIAWLLGVISDKKPWPRQPYHWEDAGTDA